MEIIVYIIELLNFKKEVGVNGLGTFFKKKSPGRYDAQTHSFLPPSYSLAFTQDVTETNSLALHINKQRNVSLSTVSYFISEFVEELKRTVDQNGSYELPGIGKLIGTKEQLTLVSENTANFGFDFFALPAVKSEISATTEDNLQSVVEENLIEEENPDRHPYIETVTPDSSDLELEQDVVEEFARETISLEETSNQEVEEEVTSEVPATVTEDETNAQHQEELSNSDKESISTENNEVVLDQDITPLEKELPDETEEESVVIEQTVDDIDTSNLDIKPVEAVEDEQVIEVGSQKEFEPNKAEPEEHSVFEEINEFRAPEEIIPVVAPRHIETITPEETAKEAEVETTTHTTVNQSLADQAAEISRTEEPIDQEKSIEKKGLSWFVKTIIILVCIAILGAVVYFINPNIYNVLIRKDVHPDQKMVLSSDPKVGLKNVEDSLSFADSIMNTAKEVGIKVDKAKDTLKFTVKAEPLNTTTYEIVGVAYKTQKEVDDYIARMKKRGYAAKAIDKMPGRMTKISLATYNNREAARKDLEKFQKELNNPGIYIYVNKNKE